MSKNGNHRFRALLDERNLTIEKLADETGLGQTTIWRALNKQRIGGGSRQILCDYFGTTAAALGLVDSPGTEEGQEVLSNLHSAFLPALQTHITPYASQAILPAIPSGQRLTTQPAPKLLEEYTGIWLAIGAGNLGNLFDEGWSIEMVLNALSIVLQSIQGMPPTTRQRLSQPEASLFFHTNNVTDEERIQATNALGKSIEQGWKLFHSASNAQVLAVSQAQLYLIQHVHSYLLPDIKYQLFAAIYNLLGLSLHFQECYAEALQAHNSAYIAALQSGDLWSITQSLLSQAYGLEEYGRHSEAIQTIQGALRLIEHQTEEAYIRSKAHLLGCWAFSAMAIGDYKTVQEKLEAALILLNQIQASEDFDRVSWLQLSGKYALLVGDYTKAVQDFEAALKELSPSSLVRRIITLLSLARANAHKRDLETSLLFARKVIPHMQQFNAPMTNRQFAEYVQEDLQRLFPDETQVREFIHETRAELPQLHK